MQEQSGLTLVKNIYGFLEGVGISHWLLNTLVVFTVFSVILIAILKYGWKYIEPFLNWMKKNVFANKDRKKVWDNVDKTNTAVEGLSDAVEEIKQTLKTIGAKVEHQSSTIGSIKDDLSSIKENQAIQDGKINILTKDAQLYQDRMEHYKSMDLETAVELEIEVDTYLFSEFWKRLWEYGDDNYDSSHISPMFHTLISDTFKFFDKRANELCINESIRKILAEATELTNKYAQAFFDQFVLLYENKEIKPRKKFLKAFVDKSEAEYKSFFKQIFQKLVKRALHG